MFHRLFHLACAARPVDHDDWGSESQVAAENAFHIACEEAVLKAFAEDAPYSAWALKATTEERIAESLAIVLAKWFGDSLRSELGDAEIADVVRVNAARNDGTCASHDHCDPNVNMLGAFVALGIPSPVDFADSNSPEHEAACVLWNRAWDIAKAANFAL